MAEGTDIGVEEFIEKIKSFRKDEKYKWINPQGDHEAKLMIILSYPGVDATMEHDLLAGANGVELANALELAGFKETDYYLTTMVKHSIGNISKPTNAQINDCAAALDYEIEVVKPQLIITLGAEPFKRIKKENAKITDYMGNIIDCPYGKLLPNFSPGMIVIQDPKKRPAFREVFELAKRFLDGTLTYTPFEHIFVDDPAVNREIIQYYIDNNMLTVGYDAEWFGQKMTDDEVMYTFQYSCEPHKAVILDISKDGITENQELLETMRPLLEHPKAERMGWNIRADDKRLILRGIKPLEETLAFDGMKACAFIDSRWPKGLETGIRYFTNYRPYYKEITDLLKQHSLKPHELAKLKLIDPNTFYEYCAGDAVAHRTACLGMRERILKLPKKQKDYWFNTYLPLSNYFIDLEMTGISIDLDVMEDITEKYVSKYEELKESLLSQTKPYMDEFNPNSTPNKKTLLFEKLNLTPAFYTKSGKSPKSRAWYEKQKSATQKQYSPSTNNKSLATIAFDLESELQADGDNEELKKKHKLVKTMLDLGRVGVFANKFLCKDDTRFATVEKDEAEDAEWDNQEEAAEAMLTTVFEGKKTSYWAAICQDGRIHPDFFECLNNFRSSSRPNVQNPASKVLSHIPTIFVPNYKSLSKEEKKEADKNLIPRNVRHIFYTGSKDWYWSEVDVAGADLAIAAFCSGDKEYIHDILEGGFHLKKAREYFQDETISKDDYSKYVSAKAITFRVAYTAELMSAAMPIQAEIYAESGIYVDIKRIEYALKTWERYEQYMAFRKTCTKQVDEHKYIENLKGIKYYFEDSEDFKILAGWKNESLAYPIASELALFLWDVSVQMKKQFKRDGMWMKWIYPVNSVHDASYWSIHKDLMKDGYFPEICKYFFTKQCKITTGDNLGMEMVVADRWKGKEAVFHGETQWNFQQKCWDWKK
jgi:uracil-DNA glycosylase family 4